MYVDGNFNVAMTSDKKFLISINVVKNNSKNNNDELYPASVEKVIVAKDTNDLINKIKIILKYIKPNKKAMDITETEFEKIFNQITKEE